MAIKRIMKHLFTLHDKHVTRDHHHVSRRNCYGDYESYRALTWITGRTSLTTVNTVEARTAGNVTLGSGESPGAETPARVGITGPVLAITHRRTLGPVVARLANCVTFHSYNKCKNKIFVKFYIVVVVMLLLLLVAGQHLKFLLKMSTMLLFYRNRVSGNKTTILQIPS